MNERERGLWKLRLNWFLVVFLGQIVYAVSCIAYLTSFHRFVTNPKSKDLSDTQKYNVKIDPGLGESEFFYSLIITSLYTAASIGTLLNGFLVMCVPYWYLNVISLSAHILGYTVYGVATQGWHLIISQLLVGYFLGAQLTLGFSYAADSSFTYAALIEEKERKVDEEYRQRVRDLLYTLLSFGNVLGFFIGPGVAVLLTHLPIDQFHSIAWFNVAVASILLLLDIFLFRGEASCKKFQCCQSSSTCTSSRPGILKIFIILSMILLSLIDMLKWGIYETLLSPVLSDSFGLSLSVASYFYLGLGIPRFLGSFLLFILQKIKLPNTLLLLIGILGTMTSYLILADWQTIPYDPCTEYSPFHHPDMITRLNQTKFNFTSKMQNNFSRIRTVDVKLTTHFVLGFENSSSVHASYSMGTASFTCALNPQCNCHETAYHDLGGRFFPCLEVSTSKQVSNNSNKPLQSFLCSFSGTSFCLKMYGESSINTKPELNPENQAQTQAFLLLNDSTYEIASNSCMNADVPGHQCHWIPFSTITNTKCNDCPPICRAKDQTFNFVQLLAGLSLIFLFFPVVWVPLMAIVTNHAPSINGSQGILIGIVNTTNQMAQALSPLIIDAAYEGTQKRTFLICIILAVAHVPFVLEIVLLYKQLGSQTNKRRQQ